MKTNLHATGIDMPVYVLHGELGSEGGRRAQWVKHLLHEREGLSSNPKACLTPVAAASRVCNTSTWVRLIWLWFTKLYRGNASTFLDRRAV